VGHLIIVGEFAMEMATLRSAIFTDTDSVSEMMRTERTHIVSGASGSSHTEYAREKSVWVRVPGRRVVSVKPGGVSEADRTQYALLMQTHEDRLLSIAVRAFQSKGWSVGSLQFDGLFVKPMPESPMASMSIEKRVAALEETMKFASRCMFLETDFTIELVEKPLFNENYNAVILRLGQIIMEARRLS
jgi:hypothetical protein